MEKFLTALWIAGTVAQYAYAAYAYIVNDYPHDEEYLISTPAIITMTAPFWFVMWPSFVVGRLLDMARARYRGGQ